MKITTFDLYGVENSNNHGINIYNDIFFDGKNLKFNSKIEQKVNKFELISILNKSDYKICHNFYGYDGERLPTLEHHNSNNIDTLLIDCLISFNQTHHNLKKSVNNNPLEDANTTFKVLEKNIIKFHNFSNNIKNLLYSLLYNYDKYKDFFEFYNGIQSDKLRLLDKKNILNTIIEVLKEKNFNNSKNYELLENYLNNQDNQYKIAISYLIMFINSNTIVIPDFIVKGNIESKNILRSLLNDFYNEISENFNNNILEYLKEFTGFDNFRGNIQIEGVKKSLENKDILTLLSTGGGKSLIYQLPAWIVGKKLGHLTLIITPLKALIKDQIDGLRDKDFNEVNYLSGDQNSIEKDLIYNKVKSGETKILFLTPEALRSEKLLDKLENRYISRIVIDEAHTLILWGQEFRPDYFFIKYFLEDLEKKNLNNKISITLLTATATIDVEEGIIDYFKEKDIYLIISDDILKENIKGSVINIKDNDNKISILLEKIKEIQVEKNPTIIFTSRRKTAEKIEIYLNENKIISKYFHAGMLLKDKKQIQEDFIKGKLNLIVATKAFGMGIDKENVRYVIHYDLPSNIEDYTQEIGRAGRDGKVSKNIIFYSKKEIDKQIKNLNYSGLSWYNIQRFLKYVNIKDKCVLSPRQIAKQSGIKTNKKNWITDIKILLSFLELEKFNGNTILKRKYDNTYVLFNKIENKILNDCYNLIEKDNYLNNSEKNIAKVIIYKIIEQKIAIDLNNLEDNFAEDLGEDFNFGDINLNKLTNKIKSLKILSKAKDNEETNIIIEAGNILKDENFNDKIFYIYEKRLNNIENFVETNDKSSFYDKIKNYYLFKNFINEKDGKIILKNKSNLTKHFNLSVKVGKIILGYIFTEEKKYKEKQSINLNYLLLFLQKNYKNDFTITELKETLFFLDRLDIIKIKNGLFVFLTRFNIEFDENICKNLDKFKQFILTEEFKKDLIEKLENYKQVKINKLLALQKIVEILDKNNINDYSQLTHYYFKTHLKQFSKEYLINGK